MYRDAERGVERGQQPPSEIVRQREELAAVPPGWTKPAAGAQLRGDLVGTQLPGEGKGGK